MNRLLNQRISNIYLKVTIETFSKLRFSEFKKFVTRSVLGAPSCADIFELLQLKNETYGSKSVCVFSILILKGVMAS